MTTIPLKLNGYTDLPKGKIANIVTNLELFALPDWVKRYQAPQGFSVTRQEKPTAQWYRSLYDAVGRDWLWFSRAIIQEQKLTSLLQNPQIEVFEAKFADRSIGLLELDFREEAQCEIAYFGLISGLTGQGFGRALMAEALHHAFRQTIKRVWIHTCTHDSPAGLALYLKCGFKPYLYQVEVADDPRLSGHLPPTAGAQFPVIA